MQTLRFTEPQELNIQGVTVQASLLFSPGTPANLLGRDVLCKLGAKIHCGERGVWVELPESLIRQHVMMETKLEQCIMDKVYWLELDKMKSGIRDLYAKWKPWLIKMRPECKESREPWHCTMMYDEEGQNEEYEAMWDEHVARTQYSLKTIDFIVGPQGAAAAVQLPKQLEQWYQIPDAALHVSLLIGQGFESKELGPMVKEAGILGMLEAFGKAASPTNIGKFDSRKQIQLHIPA
ncbi:hypothetical protein QTP86_011340 [Hemibagrus guttatus]|nr:hypothetical protein QTP86_011340 [Hemibagrus guttatus]